jgi:hypothetical protein
VGVTSSMHKENEKCKQETLKRKSSFRILKCGFVLSDA